MILKRYNMVQVVILENNFFKCTYQCISSDWLHRDSVFVRFLDFYFSR